MTTPLITLATTPLPSLAQLGGGGGVFAGFFLVGIILVIALAIAGLASLAGLIYIWIRALKQPTYSQGLANCGRCGYGVRGSATLTCPECGADFREVGIHSPAMRKAFISPALFITLWSLCLWVPGCVVSSIALAVGPQQQINYEDVYLAPPDTNAAGYDDISLNRTPYGINSALFAGEIYTSQEDYIDVSINGPNSYEWYELDLTNNTYDDYSGMPAQPFNRAVLEKWITNAGGDIKNPDVQQQIDQVYNSIQQTPNAGIVGANWSTFTVNSQNTWADYEPAGWFIFVQPAFWVLVYAVGIVLYFILKNRYDQTAAKLRDQALAQDPHASPDLPTGSF